MVINKIILNHLLEHWQSQSNLSNPISYMTKVVTPLCVHPQGFLTHGVDSEQVVYWMGMIMYCIK